MRILVLVLLFLTACGKKNLTLKIGDQDILAFGPQDNCNYMTNLGMRVSWKSDTPLRMTIDSSVPAEFDEEIHKAVNQWNSKYGKVILEAGRNPYFASPPGNDRTSAIYWFKDWDEGEARKQAWTGTTWEISKIRDADIRVNAKNFSYFKEGAGDSTGKVHLESLMVHEFGHALGLSHNEAGDSVMQPTLKSGAIRNSPSGGDIENLRCEY